MDSDINRKNIWLDCDPGVDDMVAIMLAIHNPVLNLLGISTVGGNLSTEIVNRNVLNILNVSTLQEIPVFQGASEPLCRECGASQSPIHGKNGLCYDFKFPFHEKKIREENLFFYLANLIMGSQAKITLIATGALTNYALLLKTFPKVKENIESIVHMGGAVEIGNYSPSAEFNIAWDPEAAKIVFNSGIRVVMIPLGVTLKTKIDEKVFNFFKKLNSNFGNLLFNIFECLNHNLAEISHKQEYIGSIHDPCAVAYVINPDIFKTQDMHVEVESKSQFCDGRTVCDVYDKLKQKKNVVVGIDIDLEKFWTLIYDVWKECDRVSILN